MNSGLALNRPVMPQSLLDLCEENPEIASEGYGEHTLPMDCLRNGIMPVCSNVDIDDSEDETDESQNEPADVPVPMENRHMYYCTFDGAVALSSDPLVVAAASEFYPMQSPLE